VLVPVTATLAVLTGTVVRMLLLSIVIVTGTEGAAPIWLFDNESFVNEKTSL
jgi:hypothetical protein